MVDDDVPNAAFYVREVWRTLSRVDGRCRAVSADVHSSGAGMARFVADLARDAIGV
jgi:hypothetical protein